jgi:hypothetical protein
VADEQNKLFAKLDRSVVEFARARAKQSTTTALPC